MKAFIPLAPIALLLLAYSGWAPLAWLRRVPEGEEWRPLASALPVVRAMLIGTLVDELMRRMEKEQRARDEGVNPTP